MLGLPTVSAVESGPTAQALFKSLLSGVDNCTREQLTAKEIAANEHLNELKNVTLINILVVVVLVVVLLANAKEGKYSRTLYFGPDWSSLRPCRGQTDDLINKE